MAGSLPLSMRASVRSSHAAGPYRVLRLCAPPVAVGAQPGQFVSLAVRVAGTLLPRPFSVAGVGPPEGLIEIVVAIAGRGTAWLAERSAGDVVDLVGPLGTGFHLPEEPSRCVLVGGGYGSAPLGWLAKTLTGRGHRVTAVLGAATADRVFRSEAMGSAAGGVTVTTEDGSLGLRGRVTDPLPGILARERATAVYACGPMPMLAAVASAARHHGAQCEVAVEELMACGVGVCMTCVVPYRGHDGPSSVRACIEGPVLDGAGVDWVPLHWKARDD